MATNGAQEGKQSGKGFAGLESMLSNVDEAARKAETESAARAAASEPGHAESSPQTARSQPGPSDPVVRGRRSGADWWLISWAVLAAVGAYFVWIDLTSERSVLIGLNSDKSASRRYDRLATSGTNFSSPAALTEEKPPVGTDHVLTVAQLRYCASEKIRIEAAKKALNVYVSSDVDRFNAIVDDYNSRCGSFRYRRGALESAQRDVERIRFLLEVEGGMRLSQPLGGR